MEYFCEQMFIHISLSSQDDPPKEKKNIILFMQIFNKASVKYLRKQDDAPASAFKHLIEEGRFAGCF